MNKIITHSGQFHMDEILFISLFEIFFEKEFEIIRTRNKEFIEKNRNKAYIADVGMIYDNKYNFDHHQDDSLPAACMLGWNFIKEQLNIDKNRYKKLESFVLEASLADTQVTMPAEFSASQMILKLNYLGEQEGFKIAKKIVKNMVISIKKEDEEIYKAKNILKSAKKYFNSKLIEFEQFIPSWKYEINGIKTPEIEHVFWKNNDGNYCLQAVPKNYDSFELHGMKLIDCTLPDFLHKKMFFAVFKNKKKLLEYVEKLYKNKK